SLHAVEVSGAAHGGFPARMVNSAAAEDAAGAPAGEGGEDHAQDAVAPRPAVGEFEDLALDPDLFDGQGEIGDRYRIAVLEQPDLGEILAGGGDRGQRDLGPEQAAVDEADPVGIGVVEGGGLAQPDHRAAPVEVVLAEAADDHVAHPVAGDGAAFLRRIDAQVVDADAEAAQLAEVGDVRQLAGRGGHVESGRALEHHRAAVQPYAEAAGLLDQADRGVGTADHDDHVGRFVARIEDRAVEHD